MPGYWLGLSDGHVMIRHGLFSGRLSGRAPYVGLCLAFLHGLMICTAAAETGALAIFPARSWALYIYRASLRASN